MSRVQFIVSFALPENAEPADARRYVEEAIRRWCLSRESKDPMRQLKEDTVKVE